MSLSGLLAQVLNGVQYGLLLYLIASGLTLVFGVLGIINLAHGSMFMIGAYTAYVVTKHTGSLLLALPAGAGIGVLLGLLLERGLFRYFYRREHLDQVLLTFALILLFEEGRSLLVGNDFYSVPVPAALDFSVPVATGFSYSAYRFAVIAVCLLLAVVLAVLIERTKLGAVIRAAAEKPEMVDVIGIDARKVYLVVFALGTALAMTAGVLAAPLYSVYPGIGDGFLIISFVVVVIGGLGSVSGAFWAALAIGLVDTLGKAYLPKIAGLSVYLLMAIVLLWRPAGLFTTPQGHVARAIHPLPKSALGWLALAAGTVAIGLMPMLVSAYYVELGTFALISAMLALSLQLLVGCVGLVSLGHAAFYGLAAYAIYLATPESAGLPIWQSLPLAMAVAGLAALIVGALSLRARGFAFLMVTLAFGQMVFFLFHDTKLGGGADGAYLARPIVSALGWELQLPRRQRPIGTFYVALALLAAMYLFLAVLVRSLFGQVLEGIRVNESRMQALGYHTTLYKLAAFVIAGVLAGVAGHMWAMHRGFVNPELVSWHRSAETLLMILLGGLGSLHGAILGALAYVALGEASQLLTERKLLVEGLVILLVVLVLPSGIAGLLRRRERADATAAAPAGISPASASASTPAAVHATGGGGS